MDADQHAEALRGGSEPAFQARALAYLYVAGAGLGAISLALPHPARQDDFALSIVIACACMGAAVMLLAAARFTVPLCGVFLAGGTLLISAAVYFSGQGDGPYSVYYIWVGIYAFYFYSTVWASVEAALVGVAYGGLLAFAGLSTSAPVTRWLLTVGTMVVAGALVARLVARVRERAAEAAARADSLRIEQDRTRAIVETAREAFIGLDARGRVVDWNPAAEATFGWSHARAVGASAADLLAPVRHREAWRAGFERLARTGHVPQLNRRTTLRVLHRDGREITCEMGFAQIVADPEPVYSAFIHDISDRIAAEQEVRARAEDMAVVADVARDLATVTDANAARAAICGAARDVSGCKAAILYEPDAHGRELVSTFVEGAHVPTIRLPFAGERSGAIVAFSSGQPFFVADLVGHPAVAQQQVTALEVVSALWQPVLANGVSIGVLTVAWDRRVEELPDRLASLMALLAAEAAVAIERADLLARLEAVARTDDLTGLANRRAWEEQLPRELARAQRDERPLCVAMLDLDRFKDYNDEHGHQAGDRLLKQLAGTWRDALRPTDVLARYGGEEFVVLLPNCSLERAVDVIERLRGATPDGQTCSAGVARWDERETSEGLVSRADEALYRAKHEGRDCTVPAAG